MSGNVTPWWEVLKLRDEVVHASGSIDDVQMTMVITVVLVVLVIFAFLQNVRAIRSCASVTRKSRSNWS